jgi:hypothetical protein
MTWWLSGGVDTHGQYTTELPCLLLKNFFLKKKSPYLGCPHLLVFFGLGQAHGHVVEPSYFFNFLFLVSHLLNHVGMWNLLLVPHWWKKKIVFTPTQIKLNSFFFQLLFLTISLTNCYKPINHLTRIIFLLFINT